MPDIISSTSDLTPAGILGWTKGIAVTVGAALTALSDILSEDWAPKRYVQAGILICTAIVTILAPNKVQRVVVADQP